MWPSSDGPVCDSHQESILLFSTDVFERQLIVSTGYSVSVSQAQHGVYQPTLHPCPSSSILRLWTHLITITLCSFQTQLPAVHFELCALAWWAWWPGSGPAEPSRPTARGAQHITAWHEVYDSHM
jgi:hypothetical protein